MSRVIRVAGGAVLVSLIVGGGSVWAGNGDGANDPVDPPPAPVDPPVITAEVEVPDTEEPGGPGTVAVEIPCSWSRVPASSEQADALNTIYEVVAIVINVVVGGSFVVEVTFYSEDGVLHRYDEVSDRYEYEVVADCTGATAPAGWSTGDIDWWTTSDPDPVLLLPGARREATRPITFPVPDLSPADEGVVNLGMWLAVQPAGPISVEARLGSRVLGADDRHRDGDDVRSRQRRASRGVSGVRHPHPGIGTRLDR